MIGTEMNHLRNLILYKSQYQQTAGAKHLLQSGLEHLVILSGHKASTVSNMLHLTTAYA